MNLHELKLNELVDVYNELNPEKPAGPKTFKNKAAAIDRITCLKAKNAAVKAVEETFAKNAPVEEHDHEEPILDSPEPAVVEEEPTITVKPHPAYSVVGSRSQIGKAICAYLTAGAGSVSNQVVLEKIRAQFPEAKTTLGCVSWYASKLRKAGSSLPRSKSGK